METYKIIIPIENEEEEVMQLKNVAESVTGVSLSSGKTKGLDGEFCYEVLGNLKDIIEFTGALVTIYSFLAERRVKIVGDTNYSQNNIKLKDIVTILKQRFNNNK